MMQETKYARRHSGLELEYVEQGQACGLPVILLPGFTDSCRSFAPLIRHLPQDFRCIALSQRGHGDSARPAAGYRPDDFVADLAGLLDSLDIPGAVIVGHCLGAQVAQRFATEHPRRTRGVVLIGAYRSLRGNPAVHDLWNSVAIMADPIDPGFVRDFQGSTLARPVPRAFFEGVVAESLKVPARVWQAVLDSQCGDELPPTGGRIAAPTLILWGENDGICSRAEQDALTASIAGAELIVYPDAGHAPHWEAPERAAADLRAFAARRGLLMSRHAAACEAG